MNFSDYMTLDNFKEIYKAKNAEGPIDNQWREVYHNAIRDNFNNFIIQFLKDYNEKIGLPKINFGEGHNTNFQTEWNILVDKKYKDTDYFFDIPQMFAKTVTKDLYKGKDILTEEEIKEAYDNLIKTVNSGTFDEYYLSDYHACFECGQELKTSFNKWQPEFFLLEVELFKKEGGGMGFNRTVSNPEPCIDQKTIELKINFPTGELLMADWIRIPEFTKTVSTKDFSINNSAGCVKSTKQHLEKFNVITVHLGNCSPTIMFDKESNSFIFGRLEEDDESLKDKKSKYKNVGYICTDLWNATIIDKADLIRILSDKLGDDSENVVNEYIKKELNSYGTKVIQVEPGDYILKFNPNYSNFKKYTKDEKFPTDVKPFFTLKKAALAPAKKLKR